ncbi:MAG: M1 family metallopeptidase, partial [Planctomycetota bacterium]
MKITRSLILRIIAGSFVAVAFMNCSSLTSRDSREHRDLSIVKYPMDIHTHAEPNRVAITHASLNLIIDFAKKELRGSVTHTLSRTDPNAPLVLDAQGIVVERVAGAGGEPREFSLSAENPALGSSLTIQLQPADKTITIYYKTTERSDALQWLDPAQTAGGKQPFLFTQGQSIFTRTWIPIQDSPSVRITYDASVLCAAPGLTPVMSAERHGQTKDGYHRFSLKLPIPPYLIALACGDIEFQPVSDRCGIWAEPSIIKQARYEFEDTEKMVVAVERIFGPYRWGRYDIIVLPPAFPFGGMENPMLTFATPTVLAGDKSLVSLVAHELSHSWSGNLVTNATWSDFWLNEGFTVYLEGRVMEEIYGKDRALMEQQRGRHDLEREMKDLDTKDQILHIDLAGRHPDDGFSGVPYEKGAMFLRRIEELAGRDAFGTFLTNYFNEYSFQSITTDTFITYLKKNLLRSVPGALEKLNIEEWLTKPGLPDDAPRAESRALAEVKKAVDAWNTGKLTQNFDTSNWTTLQWVHFITNLSAETGTHEMAELDRRFHFTNSKNCEILGEWLRLAVEKNYQPADARTEEFLLAVGRRKYLKPIYTEYAKTDEGKKRGREIYAKARSKYHAMSRATV